MLGEKNCFFLFQEEELELTKSMGRSNLRDDKKYGKILRRQRREDSWSSSYGGKEPRRREGRRWKESFAEK